MKTKDKIAPPKFTSEAIASPGVNVERERSVLALAEKGLVENQALSTSTPIETAKLAATTQRFLVTENNEDPLLSIDLPLSTRIVALPFALLGTLATTLWTSLGVAAGYVGASSLAATGITWGLLLVPVPAVLAAVCLVGAIRFWRIVILGKIKMRTSTAEILAGTR